MALQVGLAHHVQAVLIAQPVEVVVVAVMGCSDCVEVVLLHQHDILKHRGLRHRAPIIRIGIVAVRSL